MFLQSSCRLLARAPVMPLRAKITNPALLGNASRQFASAIPTTEQPGDEPNDVLFDSQNGLRTIKLNRPKKLNSLDGSMCRKILPRLQEWSKSDMASMVVLKGEGRALCAGGDVAWLALRNKDGESQKSKDFFALEYKLDHLIATYNKPYIALMDGITMGGGVGLSLHAPFRIATENTVFAMPETTIGFFPDVGASFFLPRLDGELGMYFALTSEQLKGAGVFYAGVATHYLHSSSLPDLEERLGELRFNDDETRQQRLKIIDNTIEEFSTGLPEDQNPSQMVVGGPIRQAIDFVFQPRHNVDDILAALDEYANDKGSNTPQEVKQWAGKTQKTILQRSPTSVRVTWKQLRESSKWSIGETFLKEHTMASVFMDHPDFIEGVSALLIDKPKRTPNWAPKTLEEVTDADVDAFFQPQSTLKLLNTDDSANYREYPHAFLGLPKEKQVQDYLRQNKVASRKAVVKHFVQQFNGKQGVQQKVEEILTRKTTVENGTVNWQ